ncbi:DUF625-domain-containing protein [Phellopilus nigrolimitatus]|nr:DUF625-domain-containing protein [Phellopilus nigrolimitatus]
MNRGVADNKATHDANPSEERSDHAANGLAPNAPNTTTSTNTSIGGGVGAAALSVEESRERSPGPHLEEMASTVEEEGGFIRMNGPVYELVGSRWTDRGTAFCQGDFDNEADEARLVAKSEATSDILLNCLIRATDVYQRQQDTLIVWTEPDGTDFALSFQDIEGCSEVWEFIVEVQKHLNSRGTPYDDPDVYSTFDGSDDAISVPPENFYFPSTAAQIIQSGHLPTPNADAPFIAEIEKAMRTMARSPKSRETICNYIQENKYIHQLLDAFEVAERDENLDALHALCSCMQTILLLNEHQMYEHILMDELWMGVVGMLEYDPEFPKYKANYREFLLQRSRFVQPIVIDDQGVQRKIHHTYRLQYLKDVILGRALDDSTFNVLNSCIIFNQIDIINHVQQDEHFLSELVSLFIHPENGKGKGKEKEEDSSMEVDRPLDKSPGINGSGSSPRAGLLSSQPHTSQDHDDTDRKKEVISLLQQLCVMGKNVQLPTRINLFRTLVERGILYAVQWALCRPEKHLVNTAGEILAVLLDHHTLSVRNHVLSQAVGLGQPNGHSEAMVGQDPIKALDVVLNGSPPPFKETLTQVLCRMLANSHDLALQNQLADALRMMTDVPLVELMNELQVCGNFLLNRPPRDDHSTERYLDNFYKVSVETLLRPLTHDIPDHHELKNTPFKPSRERGNLYLYLCDLLCSFAIQHSFRSYFFVLSSNIVSRVASLLSIRDKHLCLAALRFFRICLKMNNRNLFTHMHKHECFTPIANLAVREARRENLLSSTCQEFFEYMRKENLKDPINHIMEKHEADMRELAKSALGASTFQGVVARWEINKEPLPAEGEKRQPIAIPRVFGARVMESEEDDSYFNSDDNDEDQIVPVPRAESFLGLFRRKRQRISVPGPGAQANRGMRPMNVPVQQRPASPLSSLLDYDEDDDVPTQTSNQSRPGQEPSAPESPVLPHRQIQILPYEPSQVESSDPEDDLLEALVSKGVDTTSSTRPAGPPKSQPALESAQMRPREKRRRGDDSGDDEDDMLERLAPKNRRLSNASITSNASSDDETRAKARATALKPTEDGPKKLKLKFSVSRPLAESKSAMPPRADVKDGGNG